MKKKPVDAYEKYFGITKPEERALLKLEDDLVLYDQFLRNEASLRGLSAEQIQESRRKVAEVLKSVRKNRQEFSPSRKRGQKHS